MADPNIFDALNSINEKIPIYKYHKKTAPAYMLMLWLSHYEALMPYLDKLNERLFGMPDKLVFSALYKGIPKSKRFTKWDKKTGTDKKLIKKKEEIVTELKEVYSFSDFEARTIFKRYIDI